MLLKRDEATTTTVSPTATAARRRSALALVVYRLGVAPRRPSAGMASTEPPLLQAYWQVVDGDGLFPDAQAVVSFMSPDTSHALLSDPSAAKAMISSLNRIVRALVDQFAVKGSLSMAGFSSASMRSRSLDVATKACHCGDDALLGAFMTALPTLYKPGCLLKDVRSVLGAVWVLLLDELIYRTAERQITDPPTMARQSRHCGPPEDDGLGRARVGRLAINPLLLRLSVEWMSVTVERRIGRMMGCDGPGQSLAVFAITCPRALLSAVPDVVDTVLVHMAALMDALSPAAAELHLRVLLRTLEGVAVVDPGRLGRADGAARTLTRVHTFLTTGTGRVCPPGGGATDTVMHLLCVVGGTWTVLAAAPTALTFLTELCAAGPPPTGCRSYVAPAASLALHVATHSLASSSRSVPAPLVAARPTWVALSRRRRGGGGDDVAAAVGSALVAVTAEPYRLAAQVMRPPTGVAPWSSAPFPPACLQRLTQPERCWACGNGHMAGAPRKPLSKCSACGVGTYCGATCAKASWRAGHKRACGAWAAYGAAQANAMVSLGALHGEGGVDAATESRISRTRAGVYAVQQEDLTASDAAGWAWPRARARQVEAAGLQLRDVVALVERPTGTIVVVPAASYAQWAGAVPAAVLHGAARAHGGRALRVIHRVHPPHVQVFGPRALGLEEGTSPPDGSTLA